MPIPPGRRPTVEIIVAGSITAGGSNDKNTFTTFHFQRSVAAGAVNKVNVDTAFQAAIGVPMIAALNARWSQRYNTVRIVDDTLDPPSQISHVNVGGVAGDSMDTFSCVFIFARTIQKGKSYRGGYHFGPLSEVDTTTPNSDVLNAAAIARFTPLAAAILAGFTDAGGQIWVPVVLSRTQSQLRNEPTTVVATPVFQTLLNQRIGSNTRRKVKSVY